MQGFDVKDGYALAKLLPQNGIEPVIITGRSSEIVSKRAEELGLRYIYQGVQDKAECLRAFAAERGIELTQIAGIGDDLPDLPMLRLCGVVACPSDAVEQVKSIADHICKNKGGEGAVREFSEALLAIQKA